MALILIDFLEIDDFPQIRWLQPLSDGYKADVGAGTKMSCVWTTECVRFRVAYHTLYTYWTCNMTMNRNSND